MRRKNNHRNDTHICEAASAGTALRILLQIHVVSVEGEDIERGVTSNVCLGTGEAIQDHLKYRDGKLVQDPGQ